MTMIESYFKPDSELIKLRQAGHSANKIAQLLNKHESYVLNLLRIAQILYNYDFGLDIRKYRFLQSKDELLKFYTDSTEELAKKHKISKLILRYAINHYNIPMNKWADKSKNRQAEIHDLKLPLQLISKEWLIENYIKRRKSLLDISAELGCSITPVRYQLKRYNISIRPPKRYDQGQKSSSSYGIMTYYTPVKCPKKKVIFRSLLELGYAMMLDNDPKIKAWDYEVMWTYYFDGFTGKRRKYICDFRVTFQNNIEFDGNREHGQKVVEHIEVKPKSRQIFEDKYLYAQNIIPNWRFITEDEITQCEEILNIADLSRVTIPLILQPKSKKYVVWSKEDHIDLPLHHRILYKRKKGQFYSFKVINDKLVEDRASKVIMERPRNLHESHGKDLELDLNRILDLVKQDKPVKEISGTFGCNYRTVIKFLEDRSYVINWHSNSSRHNEIRHATRKIWPPDNFPARNTNRYRMNYKWDNYNWLYEQYWIKGLSTRHIGRLVGKSHRLIIKKFKKHGITSRIRDEKKTSGIDVY